MYTLSNDELDITVLDPVADRERLGTRYCSGGYIFQVADHTHGDLMSGPTYPDSYNIFDGQGMPDAFNLRPLREAADTDSMALVIGTGVCDLTANKVEEWCAWQVVEGPESITMTARQEFRGFQVETTRTVSLHGRTIRSHTNVRNSGRGQVPLFWFPHPFYPHPDTNELIKLNIAVCLPDNPGYEIAPSSFITRKDWPWSDGYYQILDHAAATNLVIQQKHPKLGLVAATCSYVPSFFPIWGNSRTFSWEPFLERTIPPEQETNWWIDYEF
jgi:hypothetical protein